MVVIGNSVCVYVSEWLVNASEQNFSDASWLEQATFQWNIDDARYALDEHI
jgi:hypothetical protein